MGGDKSGDGQPGDCGTLQCESTNRPAMVSVASTARWLAASSARDEVRSGFCTTDGVQTFWGSESSCLYPTEKRPGKEAGAAAPETGRISQF